MFLQLLIPTDAFYSGDGGLKALLAEQLSAGQWRFDLNLPVAEWVRSLWEDGLYPFKPPFVYQRQEHYYITFPFTFPLVTAPFHALLGFRGLYVVPLIATWALWFSFYSACQRFKLGPISTAIALATLIFASPLSLYSAMYWEHTLAVALAFQGLAMVLIPSEQELSTPKAIASGILVGLAVWFRPEFLCLVGILTLLTIVTQVKVLRSPQWLPSKAPVVVGSMIVTVAIFFAINKAVYGHPLGIHAVQIVEGFSLSKRLSDALKNLQELGWSLVYYFPVVFIPVIYSVLSLFSRRLKLSPQMQTILITSALFLLAVPLIVPLGAGGKQWGPRFLLILIPLASLLAIAQIQSVNQTAKSSLRYAFLGLFSVFFAVGLYINSYLGVADLKQNNQIAADAVMSLRTQPNSIVGISHQYVAQALSPNFQEKTFFLAENPEDLEKLSTTLLAQGQNEFLYLCYPHRPCDLPQTMQNRSLTIANNSSLNIQFVESGKVSKYPLYTVVLTPTPAANSAQSP